jgi:hypothetical protein
MIGRLRDALTDLRETGQVPWDWIVDETRSVEDYTGAATIKDWLLEVLPAARLEAWGGEAPLIITESRSLAGVLRSLCREYCVRIAPTNGQCTGFLHNRIAPMLRSFHRILYLGDFDLAERHRNQHSARS